MNRRELLALAGTACIPVKSIACSSNEMSDEEMASKLTTYSGKNWIIHLSWKGQGTCFECWEVLLASSGTKVVVPRLRSTEPIASGWHICTCRAFDLSKLVEIRLYGPSRSEARVFYIRRDGKWRRQK